LPRRFGQASRNEGAAGEEGNKIAGRLGNDCDYGVFVYLTTLVFKGLSPSIEAGTLLGAGRGKGCEAEPRGLAAG
jgi:hypothetical protein